MKSFLVIGEECTDEFVYGKAERLSPEAPVPVFVPKRNVSNRGMAGNVIENLFALHKDAPAIVYEYTSDPSSLIKRRYVDEKSNHIFIRVDMGEAVDPFMGDDVFMKMIYSADCTIISDYNKGFLNDEAFDYIFKNAPEKQVVILDSKRPLTSSILGFVDFVKLNEHEYDNNCRVLGKEEMDRHKDKLIITMGGNGTFYNGKVYPVETRQTIDVSGAGDTFVASFAHMYMQCYDTAKSIIFANEMASIVVTKRGVSTI